MNKEEALASDWSIRMGTGLDGLRQFQCKNPVKPLQVGESRFYTEVDDLPPWLRSLAEHHTRRSSIESGDGDTRLEV